MSDKLLERLVKKKTDNNITFINEQLIAEWDQINALEKPKDEDDESFTLHEYWDSLEVED